MTLSRLQFFAQQFSFEHQAVMRTFIKFVIGLSLLIPLLALAKGDGIGFTMEGTLTNFSMSGTNCHFVFTGTFQITQWHHISSTTIEMDCKHGFPATVTQNWFFVATHPTANAAAVRNDPNALAKILERAAARGRVIKFELVNPRITYGNAGSITELQSAVVRATDWDLH
jgi:hypothetical protein